MGEKYAMRQAVTTFVNKYKWIHTIIGIIGNVCFVVGSIFFLFESVQTLGTWLFIIGSFGMLVGSVGSAIVMAHRDTEQSNDRRNQSRQASRRADTGRAMPEHSVTAPVMRGRTTRRSNR
jgi:hypothetical protein